MSYGIIGLGKMGSNLALNISNKHKLHLYNRSSAKVDNTIKKGKRGSMKGHKTILQMTQSMERPRTILTMLPHGETTNEIISHTLKLIEPGDTIIDCANEFYKESSLREKLCDKYQVNYLGTGMSGGASGALNGPAVMVGGRASAFMQQKDYLNAFCKNVVHVNNDADSGHFTKMVHNGIEYVMLQAIADMYAYFNYDYDYTSAVLRRCSSENSEMNGYLTRSAFNVLDNCDDMYNMDKIRDVAHMNDTGLWCVEYAYKNGICTPTMHSAVQARIASNFPKNTEAIGQRCNYNIDLDAAYNALRLVYAMSVYEGLMLINHKRIDEKKAQDAWSAATIIECPMIMCSKRKLMGIADESIYKARMFLIECVRNGVPVPSVSAAIQHHDFINQKKTQMNLIMAQRHYFGQHEFKTN